jgi:2-dehydro-3-deoxyphosphogluconate aldolase/(4S)-4-hydroxy-2-oxoglutarate aldolase
MSKKLDRLLESDIICVVGIGIETQEHARKVVESLIEGGMNSFELMGGVPNRDELLVELKVAHQDKIFGIGTILDTESALASIKAKADLLVSPHLDLEMIQACHRYGVISWFGALTPTDILKGREA